MTVTPLGIPRRMLEFTLDGEEARVPEGSTILDACRAAGKDVPTLCEGDTLRPKNACRVCVVEVEGARTLVPACSRKAEPGMEVRTAPASAGWSFINIRASLRCLTGGQASYSGVRRRRARR